MKNKTIYILTGISIILLLSFGFVMMKLINESSECVNNPFVYGATAIDKQGMPIFCSCSSLNPKYSGFSYDKKGIYINNLEIEE